ncbi:MAG TPA: alpha/beta hydrolase [Steroidobacteraceae bacterium]|nr:alpha/beta hydrolase [Steroidobacteraceae bacterium]
MPLDLSVERFLKKLAALNPPGALTLSVAERRDALRHMLAFAGTSPAVGSIEDRTLPGPDAAITIRRYSPAAAPPGAFPALVYFHGGGLVAGSLDTHDGICRSLCLAGGCRVLSVDYRLAPEHRFPAALSDAIAATSFIASHPAEFGVDPQRLGLCGDSAGATLAAVVAQHLARQGTLTVALQVLICPIMDLAAQTASRREYAQGYLVDESTLAHDLKYYLQEGSDPADPRISPLRTTQLAGLPPACIHTAEFDPLRDEGCLYSERLRQAGIATRYTCHPGMIHLFYGMGNLVPYAATAWNLIGSDIRALFAMA